VRVIEMATMTAYSTIIGARHGTTRYATATTTG
jgi:hypothetical protein